MKSNTLLLAIFSLSLFAQAADSIKFEAPLKDAGYSVSKAFASRRSATEFLDKAISQKDLGNVLWAANGINRKESGHRTAASAMNRQEVSLYVFDTENVYLYDALSHSITLVQKGDHRNLFGERHKTPVIILLVSDISKFSGMGTPENQRDMGVVDAGIVSGNIGVYCAGMGIATRPRASMDKEGIKKLLGLSDLQIPVLNHAIGYYK